jgi:hypothetical protein
VELINATRMVAGYTMGMDPEGREYLVVVVKGTFDIPTDGGEATLSAQQLPLVAADTFTGEPGFSAPVYESEYCLTKPRCDVLLIGNAYTPGGKPAPYTRVSLQVGPISKTIDVIGNRTWSGRGGSPSEPEPFTVMPISYDRAFGGVDNSNPDKATAYVRNPVGIGYRPLMNTDQLREQPVPNTQEPGKPITSPNGEYRPMSFGPVGRSWTPRLGYAGTYDDKWLEDTFPFLPADFDSRYYQAAPEDQQMAYPVGGEKISLVNLTSAGHLDFNLPTINLPVEFEDADFNRKALLLAIDTVLIEPEKQRISLVWRCSFTLRRNILEAKHVVVGQMPPGWYRARTSGKRYIGKVPRV